MGVYIHATKCDAISLHTQDILLTVLLSFGSALQLPLVHLPGPMVLGQPTVENPNQVHAGAALDHRWSRCSPRGGCSAGRHVAGQLVACCLALTYHLTSPTR